MPIKNSTCIPIYVPPELADKLRDLCREQKKPVSTVMRELVEAYCDEVGVPS